MVLHTCFPPPPPNPGVAQVEHAERIPGRPAAYGRLEVHDITEPTEAALHAKGIGAS